MDFTYRPTSRLLSPAEIQDERDQAIAGKQRNALMALQLQGAQEERAAAQRNALLMQQFRDSIPSPEMGASQNALMGGGGPTVANAAKIQPVDPRLSLLHQGMKAGALSPLDYISAAMPQPKPADYKVVGDALVQIGPQGVKEAYKADKAPKLPEGMRMGANGQPEWIPGYLEGRGQVARSGASQISFGAPLPAINPKTGQAEFVRPDNKGGMSFTGIRPPGDSEKPLTEGQAKAVAFASRMQAADQIMGELARKGTKTTIPGATKNSVIGDVITAASPAEQQQLVQAKRDFVNAVLRRESGAVISPEEFANAERQYFPQIGDSRPVIEQKARNRRAAIEGMRADVPTSRQDDVDRISGGNQPATNNDPLGLRGK